MKFFLSFSKQKRVFGDPVSTSSFFLVFKVFFESLLIYTLRLFGKFVTNIDRAPSFFGFFDELTGERFFLLYHWRWPFHAKKRTACVSFSCFYYLRIKKDSFGFAKEVRISRIVFHPTFISQGCVFLADKRKSAFKKTTIRSAFLAVICLFSSLSVVPLAFYSFANSNYAIYESTIREWGSSNRKNNAFLFSEAISNEASSYSVFEPQLTNYGDSLSDTYFNFLITRNSSFSINVNGYQLTSLPCIYLKSFGGYSNDHPERMRSMPVDTLFPDEVDYQSRTVENEDGFIYLTERSCNKLINSGVYSSLNEILGQKAIITWKGQNLVFAICNIISDSMRNAPKLASFLGDYFVCDLPGIFSEGTSFVFGADSIPGPAETARGVLCTLSGYSTLQFYSYSNGGYAPFVDSTLLAKTIDAPDKWTTFSFCSNFFCFSFLLVLSLLGILSSFGVFGSTNRKTVFSFYILFLFLFDLICFLLSAVFSTFFGVYVVVYFSLLALVFSFFGGRKRYV